MAKKIQDGNQIVTNVDSNDNLTFSIKDSFIDSTPTANSTNLVTSGGVKSALDINTTDIAAAVIRIANNETNISNHTSAIQTLNGNVTTNTTDIDSLETTVGTLSTSVQGNSNDIDSLEERMDTAEDTIQNDLATYNDLDTLGNQMSNNLNLSTEISMNHDLENLLEFNDFNYAVHNDSFTFIQFNFTFAEDISNIQNNLLLASGFRNPINNNDIYFSMTNINTQENYSCVIKKGQNSSSFEILPKEGTILAGTYYGTICYLIKAPISLGGGGGTDAI